MSNKPRIVITGIAGFIGSNLAEKLLNSGFEVIGIDDLSYGVFDQIPASVKFHKIDIRSKEVFSLLKRDDIVFHLAAKNCISDCQKEPVETVDINILGTVNIFEAALKAGVQKVIYAESSAMYEGIDLFPTPEGEVKAQSFYSVSKHASMLLADAYSKTYGMNFVGLRYFNVYGPKQDYRRSIPPVMSAFIIKLLKGTPPVIYGDGEKRRDFIHVDDVNRFHLLCIESDSVNGKKFNLGSGVNYSINEIYSIISSIIGIELTPLYMPELDGEASQTLADINSAESLGWRCSIKIEDGLTDMVKYFLNHKIPWTK
jgi:nucleoside-diphosphate-sugar epimerase